MPKKNGKCCKKYQEGKRCKSCPKRDKARLSRVATLALLLSAIPVVLASPALVLAGGDDWPDDWPEDGSGDGSGEGDLASRVALVNDGELEFIPTAAAAGAHYHRNRIAISEASLDQTGPDQGWVDLRQCHANLDPVPAAQILFRTEGIRDLTIAHRRDIGRAWVEGDSVQLEDVGPDAELCIQAQSRALQSLGDGLYRLRNGPYMRRFLDGYYPMRVALSIDYPAQRLRLVGQTPLTQDGFNVQQTPQGLDVEATFEGRLVTCFDFCERDNDSCGDMAPRCGTDSRPAARPASSP
ncbi:MAG: alpha/beta hydrolase [Halochromatium sp.]